MSELLLLLKVGQRDTLWADTSMWPHGWEKEKEQEEEEQDHQQHQHQLKHLRPIILSLFSSFC